jgi:transcriptional regulator with XRE-family HTH domain
MTDPAAAEIERLGRAIRLRREMLRITQETAARRAGMHRSFFGTLERGETNPTYETLLRVASALRTSMAALIASAEHDDAT